jgi:hypothetical protein
MLWMHFFPDMHGGRGKTGSEHEQSIRGIFHMNKWTDLQSLRAVLTLPLFQRVAMV